MNYLISHGHPNCEHYTMRRFRQLLVETEIAEHEAFGRQVLAMRIAHSDADSFKKWQRGHDTALERMRNPPPDNARLKRLAAARRQLRKE